MITTETRNGKTTVTFRPEKNVPIQEEIIQNFSIVMIALRDNLKKTGADVNLINSDADKIFKAAYARYYSSELNEKVDQVFSDVMNQVDGMLQS